MRKRYLFFTDDNFPSRSLPCWMLGAFSVLSWTSTIVFSFAAIRAADNAALRRSYMLHGLYLIIMPAMASVPAFIVEMWLESLPSQVISS